MVLERYTPKLTRAAALALGLFALSIEAPAAPTSPVPTLEQIATIRADPKSLLTLTPSELSTRIEALIQADPTLLSEILSETKDPKASNDQILAIGHGLGQAAKAMAATNPQLANTIASAVAATIPQGATFDPLSLGFNVGAGGAFTAATNPSGTQAGGPGGGGIGASGGAGQVNGPGQSQPGSGGGASGSANSQTGNSGSSFNSQQGSTSTPSGGSTTSTKASTSPTT